MLTLLAALAFANPPQVPHLFEKAHPRPGPVKSVMLGPVFNRLFMCVEHPEGASAPQIGDAFGTDCVVIGGLDSGYVKLYRNDGAQNEDWFSWHSDVLAPFDGIVAQINLNPVTNTPGKMGDAPASSIVFRRRDGTFVVYAHITDIKVKVGDTVKQGQTVAYVGNNGASGEPHIHIGAFKGDQPMQIRWDQRAEGSMPGFQ